MRLLGDHNLLTRELAAAMQKAVGFRNVLVHEYVDVSDGIVLDRLSDVSDHRSFCAPSLRR